MLISKYNVQIEDYPFEGGVTLYNLISKDIVFLEEKNLYRILSP